MLNKYNLLCQQIVARATHCLLYLSVCVAMLSWVLQVTHGAGFWIGLTLATGVLLVASWITFVSINTCVRRILLLEKDMNECASETLLVWESRHPNKVMGFIKRAKLPPEVITKVLVIFGITALVEPSGLAAQMGSVTVWGDQMLPLVQPGTRFTKIAAGGGHSLALKSNGTVVAWGYNYSYGWCQSTVPASLTGVVAIAAGGDNSLALKSDGTVVAWGSNSSGQANVPAGLTGVVAIAAGGDHSLALKSDGTVVAWGSNYYGETNVPAGLTGVVAIAAGNMHSLALKNNGTVVAWGGYTNYGYGEGTVPAGLTGVVAIAAGGFQSLALKSDGTVVAWGRIASGQTNVLASLVGVVAIAAGEEHSLALKSDGTVVTWGDYYFGSTDLPAGLTGVVAIAVGGAHSLALKNDGTVVAWGYNVTGQTNVPVGLTGVVAIAAGGRNSLAIVGSSNQSPSILAAPQSQFVPVGTNVTFSVTAYGSFPLAYQWYYNSGVLAGGTNATLTLTNVPLSASGGYSVLVTNSYGSTLSATAILTVYTNLAVIQTNRTPEAREIGNPTIPTDPNHFKVYTNGFFQGGLGLDTNKMTVVLTHGWNGNPSDWAEYTAQIIRQRIGVGTANIVAWDWHVEAQTNLTLAAQRTQGQGVAFGQNLVAALGANYSRRIHFIGHSLGTLVNAAAADYVHGRGFSWTNTQMTLCDEAEIAWGLGLDGVRHIVTTLPGSATKLFFNEATTQPCWGTVLPAQFAWADNYISFCGLLHTNAANAILNYEYPAPAGSWDTFYGEILNFHSYAHYFYEDTIEPGIYNTGGQINPTYLGFICSYEGGGASSRSPVNTYFYQDPNGYELNLVQTNYSGAYQMLNSRLEKYLASGANSFENESAFNWLAVNAAQAFGQVSGIQSAIDIAITLKTTVSGNSPQIQSLSASPMSGPVPMGGSGGNNTPAYVWIPLTVPSNAVSMSFNFMLQGDGKQDSFQAALGGTNLLSLETSLIQTNVNLNSGLLDVSAYGGQQVQLFLGIVGGTSTNATISASNFQFYSVASPTLQIHMAGTNVVLSWPLTALSYVLQSATTLTPPVSWAMVTNVPVIVNFQYAVTNQISSGNVFYRLATVTTPVLKAQVAGSSIVLSWPSSATGYFLETATNLATPNSWKAVVSTPSLVNQQYQITDTLAGGSRFYRLKK